MLLLIYCLLLLPLCVGIMCMDIVLLFSTFYPSSVAITLLLYFNCLPGVFCLLMLCGPSSQSWVGLQCNIVVFPAHTHLLFLTVTIHQKDN